MGALRFCLLLGALGGCDSALGLEREPGMGEGKPELDAAAPADSPIDLNCPSSYQPAGGSSYRIIDTLVRWEDAASACLVDQVASIRPTHLAVWADDTERLAVAPRIAGAYWIGLSDLRTRAVLRWNTGETGNVAGSIAWAPGQPSGSGCTTTRADDLWELAPCEEPRGFICECDLNPNDSTQYQ